MTKSDVGLANVDNTSDADKPISTAVQAALTAKADNVHIHALGDLMDVESNGASNGQSLVFNNGTWGPATVSSEGGTITDATSTTKGVVQLAGDLSGTAGAPVIGNGRVSTAKLADGFVATAKLADNSVAATKLADNAVTGAKVANNSISRAKLNAGAGSNGQVLTYDSAAGGGFRWSTVSAGQGLVWNGTSAPAGATDGDLWIDTSDLEEVKLKALVGGQWISLATGLSSDGEPAPTQLDAPTNVTALSGDSQVIVSFNPVAGATSYTVTSSPGNVTATGGGSPITVTGLVNGTTYTFTVTATDGTRTSAPSSPSNSIEPVAPDPDPDNILMLGDYAGRDPHVTGGTLSGRTVTPTDGQQCRLTITDEPLPVGTANTLTLAIDASPKDGSWVVDWFSNGSTWIGYAEIPSDGDYPLSSAPTGMTHYKVSWKLNSAATVNSMEVTLSTVVDTEAPSAVTNLQATPSNTSVGLFWTAATDNREVASYEVQVNSGSWQDIGKFTSHTITGLTAETSYTFRVRAKDAAGNLGPSNSVNSTTTATPVAPPSPAGLVPGASGYGDNFAHIFKDTQFRVKARNAPAFNPSDKYAAGREVRNQMQSVAPDINFHAYNLPFFLVDTSKSPAEGGYTWQTMTKRYYQGQHWDAPIDATYKGQTWTYNQRTANVPVPPNFRAADGTDGSASIYDIGTGQMYDFWQVQGSQGSFTYVTCAWTEHVPTSTGCHSWGTVVASGLQGAAMQVGISEIDLPVIPHAIGLELPRCEGAWNVYSLPAKFSDANSPVVAGLMQGQRLVLESSANISHLTGFTRTLAETMKEYGLIVTDTSGAVAIRGETYLGTGTNPWNTKLPGNTRYDVLRDIPWEQVYAVQKDWMGVPDA